MVKGVIMFLTLSRSSKALINRIDVALVTRNHQLIPTRYQPESMKQNLGILIVYALQTFNTVVWTAKPCVLADINEFNTCL